MSGIKVQAITKTNYLQVMEVYSTNQEFFLLTEGKEAKPENLLRDIDSIPPNFNAENKVFVGIWILSLWKNI